MALSAFPYVGGKTTLAQWIVDHLPAHTVYVEPFGGSAAVLLNKPRSTVEVYNDLDCDLVQFFEVARNQPDALIQWARRTPYSEELHNEWVTAFYDGERSEDRIERAGRFLFLRYTQFAGKYAGPSGFKRDTPRDRSGESQAWRNVPERITAVCDRLQGVSIQNGHFTEIIERYDSENTVFNCDPPYLDKEETYRVTDFEHEQLAAALEGIDGYALVSYTDRPNGLYDGWNEVTRSHYHDAGDRKNQTSKQVTERLILNYDPDSVTTFVDADQQTLVAATRGSEWCQ